MEHRNDFPLLIVTGLSGAGKSTALNVFEDLGFFSVDGVPAQLAPKLVDLFKGQMSVSNNGLVLGLDVRHRNFMGDWRAALEEIEAQGLLPQIVFVEARTEILVRRYATTRRPHPLESEGRGLEQAIVMERALLEPMRNKAALVVDTSLYSVHDLRRTIQEKWSSLETPGAGLRVHVITFGFKYGPPSEADLVFDLRFLPNPYFEDSLREFTGKDKAVADYVLAEDPGRTFLGRLEDFLHYMLPLYQAEGRYRLTIAIGCTGGRHRSVAVAEHVFASLRQKDYAVSLEHRHLDLG